MKQPERVKSREITHHTLDYGGQLDKNLEGLNPQFPQALISAVYGIREIERERGRSLTSETSESSLVGPNPMSLATKPENVLLSRTFRTPSLR